MRIFNYSHPQIKSLEEINQQIAPTDNSAQKAMLDEFEKQSSVQKTLNRLARHHVKSINRKNNTTLPQVCKSGPFTMCAEEKFLRHPTTRSFFRLAKSFDDVMSDCNAPKFEDMERFLIKPTENFRKTLGPFMREVTLVEREQKLEEWHEKHLQKYGELIEKTEKQIETRNQKLLAQGPGWGGRMTSVVSESKAAAFYTKNHLTIRGNMFKLNHELFGKSIYEILPRYGSRKKQHMAVRISQFGINAILMAAGYGLAPVSFGISTIVSNHAQTIITLSGEIIALKLDGARHEKVVSHAALRGVQLELLKIPLAGSIVNYGENAMMGSAAAGIVSTTIADWIMQSMSDRYTSTITVDDLGDPRVLSEIDKRIDYLSRFLLPTGQHLLLYEKNPEHQEKILKILKSYFKILISLEHKKIKALNFYRLALIAEKIPASHVELIRQACDNACDSTHMNTHKVVRNCLATLLSSSPTQV